MKRNRNTVARAQSDAPPADIADVLRSQARSHSSNSSWAEALESWQQLLQVVPNDFEAQYRIGQARFHLGHMEQAAAHAFQAWIQVPNDTRPGLIVARALHRLQQWDSAARAWEALSQLEPNNFEHHYRQSQALGQLGQRQAAIEAAQRALKIKPGDEDSQRLMQRISGGYIAPDSSAFNQEATLLLSEAREYSRSKRWLEAIAAWLRFTELVPRDFEGHYRLAQAQQAVGEIEAALTSATRAASLNPADSRIHLLLARLKSSVKDWKGAEELWWQMAATSPQDFEVAYRLGQCLLEQGKMSDARKWLDTASGLRPDHDGVAMLRSRVRSRGKVLRAQKLKQRQPLHGGAIDVQQQIDAGRRFITLKEWSQAEACWWMVLAERPNDFEANYRLAQCLLEQGNLGEAGKWIHKALALRPDHEGAALILGRLRAREKISRQVSAEPAPIAARSSSSIVELVLTGRTQIQNKDWQNAENTWWQVIAHNPEDFEACYRLGQSLLELGSLPDARKWLDKAHQLRPEHENVAMLLGRVRSRERLQALQLAAAKTAKGKTGKQRSQQLLRTRMEEGRELTKIGDWENAETLWWQVVSEQPDNFEANYRLGQALLELGNASESVKWLQKARKLNAEHDNAAMLLARAKRLSQAPLRNKPTPGPQKAPTPQPGSFDQLLEQGRERIRLREWEAAESLWWQALSLQPENFEANYRLGHSLLEQGKVDEAKKWLQTARKLRPDHENLISLLARCRKPKARPRTIAVTPPAPERELPAEKAAVLSLMNKGDLRAARSLLHKLLGEWPDDEELMVLQKRLARRLAVTLSAEPAAPAAAATANDDNMQRFVEARAALGSKDWALAIELWQSIAQEDNSNFEAHYRLAQAYYENEQTAEAISHAIKASEIRSEHIGNLVILGRAYQRNQQLAESIAVWRRITELDATHFETQYRLGQCYGKLGQPAEAENCFSKALSLRPDSIECLQFLTAEIAKQGRVDDAIVCWQKFIDQWPQNVRAVRLYFVFLRNNQRTAMLESVLKQLVATKPDELDSLFVYASFLVDEKRWQDVITLLKDIVAQPNEDSTLLQAATVRTYALALDTLGDLAEAEKWYRHSLSLESDSVMAITRLARVLRQLGKPEEALIFRRKACDLVPLDISHWHEYIFLLATLERETEARKVLAEAEGILPATAANLARFGRICESALFFDEANRYFARAIELDESMVVHAGLYFSRTGIVDKALDMLLKARDINGGSAEVAKALITQLRICELIGKTPVQLHRLGKKQPLLTPELLFEHFVETGMAAKPYQAVAGRVFLVTGSLGAGGAERQLVTTIRGLCRRTDNVESITLLAISLNKRFKRDFYLADIEQLPVSIRSVDELMEKSTPAPLPLQYAALVDAFPDDMRDAIRLWYHDFLEHKPAVVHAWQDSTCLTAVIAAAMAGVPRILLSTRSTRPDNPRRRLKRYMQRAYEAVMQLPTVSMLNNSRAGASDYEDWLSLPSGAVEVIYNGIDFDKLLHAADDNEAKANRARFHIPANAPVLGGVFRMSEEKRPLLWVDTAAAVLKRVPDAHFVVAGDGPMRDDMIERAQKLGIADRLHLPGHVQVASWFKLMDVVLLTSRMEGLPNVLLEAQSFGIPVVAPAVGGVAETILQNKTGWALPNATAEKLAEKIAYAMTNAKWYQQAQTLAAVFAKDNYSVDAMIGKTLKAYSFTASLASVPPQAHTTPLALAEQAFNQKDYAKAHALLDTLTSQEPGNVLPWRWLARTLQSKGEAMHAASAWRKVLALLPDDFEALYRLAEQLTRGGDASTAIHLLRQALEKNPAHDGALRQLARLLQQQQQHADALALWSHIGSHNMQDYEAAFRAGQLALTCGDIARGISLLQQAHSIAPHQYKPVELMARHYLWQGELRKARRLLLDFFKLGDEPLEALALLARILKLQGRQRMMQRLLGAMEKNAGDTPGLRLRHATWLLGFGEIAKAVAVLNATQPKTKQEQELQRMLLVTSAFARNDFSKALHYCGSEPPAFCRDLPKDHATTLRLLGAKAEDNLQSAFLHWWKLQSKQASTPAYDCIHRSVVHVTNSLEMGGTEKQAAITAALQTKDSTHFGPVTLLRTDPSLHGRAVFFLPYLVEQGVNTFTLDQVLLQARTSATPLDGVVTNAAFRRALGLAEVERLYRVFLQLKPAVVHTWSPRTPLPTLLAALLAGVPRIVLRMGTVAPDQRTDLSEEDHTYYQWFRQVLRVGLHDKRVRLAANCQSSLSGWLAWAGISPEKCGAQPLVLPNLVDISLLGASTPAAVNSLNKQLRLTPKHKVIGTVARFEPEKGLDLWLDCVALARKQLPDAIFLLIGAGRLHDELQQQIIRRHLGRHVRIVTDAGTALAPYYARMDVYLQTSLVEGLPNAVLEAKAFGLPIVATDVGGTREAAKGAANVALLPATAEALVAALCNKHAKSAYESKPHHANHAKRRSSNGAATFINAYDTGA